jgi:hypothetical protein
MPSTSPAIAFSRFQLVDGRLAPGVELQSRRHAERARLHRLAHEPVHLRRLLVVGLWPGDARRETDRVVADEPGEVGAVPELREEVEVLAERVPGDERPVVAEGVQALGLVDARVLRDRRVAPAAIADDLGRDALADRALRGRVRKQGEVAVAVRVDEARADDFPRGVDHPACVRGVVEPPHLDDPAVLDRDVPEEGRAAGAVGDPARRSGSSARSYLWPSFCRPSDGARAAVSRAFPEEVEAEHDGMIASPGKIGNHGSTST